MSTRGTGDTPLETQETAKAYLEKCKDNWQNLNPTFVLLEIGPEDKNWIDKLQARRSAEELAEPGDDARELDEKSGAKEGELSEDDPRKLYAPIPTLNERGDELLNDDDLIPKFEPFLVPAGK